MHHQRDRAFTLIELLIVVAIIAILAAIAVPNFLEAQTRSKISRAQADMRSLSTALEAYLVDYNRYPYGRTIIVYAELYKELGQTSPWNPEPSFRGLSLLTTPISYITALPPDPFAEGGGAKHYAGPNTFGTPFYTFWYDDFQAYGDHDDLVMAAAYAPFRDRNFLALHNHGYRWSLHSVGPLRKHGGMINALLGRDDANDPDDPTDTQFVAPYDPTNGTMSDGVVARTSKGIFTEVNVGKIVMP